MKHYGKKERYSILKLVLRVVTLGIATAALIIALQNKRDLQWMEHVQDNVIEKLMFPAELPGDTTNLTKK